MNFEFSTAHRVVFGRGQFDRLRELCRPLGSRILVVRGGPHLAQSGALARLEASLSGLEWTDCVVQGEPQLAQVDAILAHGRAQRSEVVIGLGGGSALDTAKAVAGLLTHAGSGLDYLEVIGSGQPGAISL